ncbi:vWA domain-containing protein [Raineyella fluvialis]|nr:vWA domain-containing protein [Raineyella fluvialis]
MRRQAQRRRIARSITAALLLPLLVAVVLFGPIPALAAPEQSSLQDVLTALSVKQEPADYVVIVDTSASMTDQGRYQRVRSGLSDMVKALGPDDRVALITFDSTPQVRRSLTALGSDRQGSISSLPAAPTGQATDIGAALATALDVMERGEIKKRGAVLLFTDGQIDTNPSSPYATVNSSGWGPLKQRAVKLQDSHDIAPWRSR